MHQNDLTEFRTLMQQLCRVFGKKLSDDISDAYWGALSDQSLSTIRARAESHMRYGKFFPKPHELRPTDDRERSADLNKADKEFQAAVAQNIANWDERLRADPVGTRREILKAYRARVTVTEHPGSVSYDEKMRWCNEIEGRLHLT